MNDRFPPRPFHTNLLSLPRDLRVKFIEFCKPVIDKPKLADPRTQQLLAEVSEDEEITDEDMRLVAQEYILFSGARAYSYNRNRPYFACMNEVNSAEFAAESRIEEWLETNLPKTNP